MKGKTAFADLGALMHGTARKAVADAARIPQLDLGEMAADGHLRVYSWRKGTFAPGEYGYLVHDTYTEPLTTTEPGGGGHAQLGGDGVHVHNVVRPPEMLPKAEWLPGTVVLVVWVFGTRPHIIGRLA